MHVFQKYKKLIAFNKQAFKDKVCKKNRSKYNTFSTTNFLQDDIF